MKRVKHNVGIDISDDDFASSILERPDLPLIARSSFLNKFEGFDAFDNWLQTHGADKNDTIICMEATGVYAEALCYWLFNKGYKVAVEPPLKVKRAFHPVGHKNDPVDSGQIAEYAYRFHDKIHLWEPRNQIVEQVAILLTTREQLVEQKTATINALKALDRKVIKNQVATDIFQQNIEKLKDQVKQIEKETQKLVDLDPQFKILVHLIKTGPGARLLLAANLLVTTNGFTKHITYTKLAAMIGVCPYEHRSGKSVWKRDQSSGMGPERLRKLLHLAARSVKTHKKPFIQYFARKEAEGKSKTLILNNIANKLLRIICAIIRERKPYIENYVSVDPRLLKNS